ncbi:uncharacterized protein [Rutidosis leptorrhynchoides]|uniref:uncharacterized protein isoform X2 n=1 Tax=Rutidosis leptorrhynchoides TaxID=125765 RepID=UPI003A994DD4
MSNLRKICRLNHAVYSSLSCCYNRARCQPRLIVSLSNPIQNPNSLKSRLIDSSNVRKMETLPCVGSRNHQRMLATAANWTDEKCPYDTLENMQQYKQIAETESETDDGDSYKPPVLTENMQLDEQIAATEVESNRKKMDLVCIDCIRFDARLFYRESLKVQDNYKYKYYDYDYFFVESKGDIVKKIEFFCVERAKIQNEYAHDETLVRHKLNDFNSNFRQANRMHALDLIYAAIDMQIRSLLDLMIEDVLDIFAKMTSDDEAYKILYENLKDNYSYADFDKMNKRVKLNRWAYEGL